MNPLLMSRMESLRHHLNVVKSNLESPVWQDKEHASCRAELKRESALWKGLEATLIMKIRRQIRNLDTIESDLRNAGAGDRAAANAAWVRFGPVQAESRALLQECLEIIGTLAIRTKGLDQLTLYIADELIRECMTRSRNDQNYYLLVNSYGKTLSKARARIIRLRFPEWTVWDLPLAGHELAHVAVSDLLVEERGEGLDQLDTYINNQRDSLISHDPELTALHASNQNEAQEEAQEEADKETQTEAQKEARRRVLVLLADAFATYMLGPAYACSTIMFRLSPSAVASTESRVDGERAGIIFAMLEWMNAKEDLQSPYRRIIDRLRTSWNDTLALGNRDAMLAEPMQGYVEQLATSFAGQLSYYLMNEAMYPAKAPDEGWLQALKWQSHWADQLKGDTVLTRPPVESGKLRDVLTACWLCRLETNGGGESSALAHNTIARAAEDLCKAVIEATRPGGSSGPQKGRL